MGYDREMPDAKENGVSYGFEGETVVMRYNDGSSNLRSWTTWMEPGASLSLVVRDFLTEESVALDQAIKRASSYEDGLDPTDPRRAAIEGLKEKLVELRFPPNQ